MTAETINTKIEIAETAADLYIEDQFSIPELTKKTGLSASEIYALFPNKKSILQFYYTSLVIRYRAMVGEIEDFESYTLNEKLSNFIYTLFDMMGERRTFVQQTFASRIADSWENTNFEEEVTDLFRDFFKSDTQIATSAAFLVNRYFFRAMKSIYIQLVKFWLTDESEHQEKTMALTDKLTSLIQEVLYNKVVDKTFDLIKYGFSQTGLSDDLQDFEEWLSGCFDIDDERKSSTENNSEQRENEDE